MATEEQTSITGAYTNIDNGSFYGQRLTIINRTISKLSMPCADNGGNGNLILGIRKVSDNSLIMEKAWGAVSSLVDYPTYYEWAEVTFDTPTFINEEVRIYARTDGAATGCIVYYLDDDTKANEYLTRWNPIDDWVDKTTNEAPYIYTYGEEGSAAPVVTTQECTNVVAQNALGNGNIQSLGTSAVTQHGHCWNTSTDPTTSHSLTENGAIANKGPFTSPITLLTPGTKYYVRAYATNTTSTSYGANVEIAGDVTTIGRRHWWTERDEFHWWAGGKHYKVTGEEDTAGLPWWWHY